MGIKAVQENSAFNIQVFGYYTGYLLSIMLYIYYFIWIILIKIIFQENKSTETQHLPQWVILSILKVEFGLPKKEGRKKRRND